MSNYHSIIRNYGEPQSNFNAELAIKALSYKQDKYDANAAKIQEAMNQYGNIDFATQRHREDFYNKINNHIENIEGLKGADLSSAAITSSITGHISKALDGETMKHIGITQSIRGFQSGYSELQKKDPSAVSETNYLDAVNESGLNAYMSGESEDLDTNKLVVKPFVDVNTNILKKAKELVDLMPDNVVQFKNNEGEMVERTIKTLTVPEWQAYLPTFFSQQDLDQIAINGRAMFGWNEEQAVKRTPEILEELNKMPQESIDRMSIIINDPNESDEKKEKAQIALDAAQKQIKKNNADVGEMGTTAIGSYFQQKNLINTIAFAIGREPDLKYVKDHTIQAALRADELRNQNNPFRDDDQALSITDLGAETPNITDKDWYDAKLTSDRSWRREVNSIFGGLSEDKQKEVQKTVQVIKKDRADEGGTITDTEALHEALLKTNLDLEQSTGLQRLLDERNHFITVEANAQREQEKSVFSNPTKVKDFYENTVGQSLGKGIQLLGTDVKTYLKNKGVTDVESFQTFLNSEDSQEFKGAVNADIFLSDTKNIVTTSPLDAKNLGQALTSDGRIDKFDKESLFYFNRLAASQGEDGVGLTDVLEFREAEFKTKGLLNFITVPAGWGRGELGWGAGRVLTEEEILDSLGDWQERMYVSIKPGAENTKTGRALIKAVENRDFSKPTPFNLQLTPDSHFYEDSTIRKMLSYDENQKGFKEKLGVEAAAIKGMNMVVLKTPANLTEAKKDVRFEEVQTLVSLRPDQYSSETKGFKMLPSLPVMMTENLDGKTITISQLNGTTSGGVSTGVHNQATVDMKTFRELAPTLYENMRFGQAEKRIDFAAQQTKTSLPISYIGIQDEKRMVDAINYTGVGQGLSMFFTKDETRKYLNDSFSNSIYAPGAPKEYAQSFDLALNNAGEFRADLVSEGGETFVNLKVGETKKIDGKNVTTYKEVYRIPTPNVGSKEQIEKILYGTPQVFLGTALAAIAIDLDSGRVEAYKRFQKAISHLQQ